MRIRVVIIVASVAIAVHALLFVALGRIAKGKGPLIPVLAAKSEPAKPAPAKPAPAKPGPTVAAALPPPASTRPTPAPHPGVRSLQSRTVRRPRRSRATPSQPAKESKTESPPPVFDIDADSATTAPSNAADH